MRILIAFVSLSQLAAQQESVALEPPYGPANRLVSPDGIYALFGIAPTAELWLENQRTHERKMVFNVTVQTLTLAWSPDSSAFIANDREASDLERTYIYDVRTLDRLDLRSRILASDPKAHPFVPNENTAPHSYCHATRWLDPKHVEVRLHGHTDGERIGNTFRPVQCFDLRYNIGKDGVVRKLSERVAPVASAGCASE